MSSSLMYHWPPGELTRLEGMEGRCESHDRGGQAGDVGEHPVVGFDLLGEKVWVRYAMKIRVGCRKKSVYIVRKRRCLLIDESVEE